LIRWKEGPCCKGPRDGRGAVKMLGHAAVRGRQAH
jgi:hypothetical protein